MILILHGMPTDNSIFLVTLLLTEVKEFCNIFVIKSKKEVSIAEKSSELSLVGRKMEQT